MVPLLLEECGDEMRSILLWCRVVFCSLHLGAICPHRSTLILRAHFLARDVSQVVLCRRASVDSEIRLLKNGWLHDGILRLVVRSELQVINLAAAFHNVLFVVFASFIVTMAGRAVTTLLSLVETEKELLVSPSVLLGARPCILDAVENAIIVIIFDILARVQHLLSVVLRIEGLWQDCMLASLL